MAIFNLNTNEYDALMERVEGNGGFQSLIRELQMRVNHTNLTIEINDETRGKISRYINDYGTGGAQNQLKRAFGKHILS